MSVKNELKALIVSSLRLTDCKPEDLKDDQRLVGGGLDVDSIDVLQLILDIERRFNIKLADGSLDENVWSSIDSLADAIEARLEAKKEA